MKQFLSIVFFLLISTALMAQNSATTTQTGTGNNSDVDQTGANNATITQLGNTNIVDVLQDGTNTTVVDQFNSTNNKASVDQDGLLNEAYVTQGMVEDYNGYTSTSMTASNNVATVDQDGNGNMVGEFIQVGDNNTGSISQNGNNNTAYAYTGWAYGFWGETAITSALSNTNSKVNISQISDGNYAAVWQYGGDNDEIKISQDGVGNLSQITQGMIYEDAPYNFPHPVYNTNDNYASVTQIGNNNNGKAMQLGDGNSFTLTQNGDGNSVGYGVGQSGLLLSRNAYFDQSGDDNTFVGTQTDGATLDHTSFQLGDLNNIDLLQGAGDVSLIQQTGDLNAANVHQYGGGQDATVMQNGNSNTSNVTQQN